ncbi:GTP 3',8-cyclase MoaA [Scopulibacillus cellulosilyticus]|uniref:GTP 3',8-cyclase n=1 Tax=Scopulibacillus cellulosilyticus TaxID=2665665 RepID=A0ABW2PYM6_9BACL
MEKIQSLLTDTLQRPLRDLRISVTDRCNFRCTYCMPKEVFDKNYPFLNKSQLLTNNEIVRLSKLFAQLGVKKIRITGGEPLLRKNLNEIISGLSRINGIEDIALTTNGTLLPKKAKELKKAGLKRVTVSLDSLDNERFGSINGQGIGVGPVLAGIQAAEEAGLEVKINMMVKKSVNDDEIIKMIEHFSGSGHVLRFIEFMDVGNSNDWSLRQVFAKKDILDLIKRHFTVEVLDQHYFGEVATRFRIKETGDEFGIISSISDAFCSSCTRARLSADGSIYTCLFASQGTSLRNPMRNGESDEMLLDRIKEVWLHRSDQYSEERKNIQPAKKRKIEMSYIGG